jgi:4-amino-4-deoxy-L-arabinose transferase-like glycosyltransferase
MLAAALRFATLDVQSFDFDESFTVGLVLNGSLGHALHMLPITESSPPLYYVLAWLWTQAFGLGEVGVRSFSATLGTALVPVAFCIGSRLCSRRAGTIVALLIAVNPFFVWYSQEARTYALLGLCSALSFWAFLRALEKPERGRLALWAAAASAAVLSHYFAGYLVAAEGVWLVYATRRRAAVLASAVVLLVAAALVPLLVSQADNRTQWIENSSLPSRVVEVAKKAVTGEIAPTRNWQLALFGLLIAGAIGYALTHLTQTERRAVGLTVGVGGVALGAPLLLDVVGLHYLISKNVTPAITILLIGAGVILGAENARHVGIAAAAAACAFFLAVSVAGAVDPALQRPDYRTAARGLGVPYPAQVVVTPNLGDMPLAHYRPGAAAIPATGWSASEVVVVRPLPRADESRRRAATPPPPPGFTFAGRVDAPSYTLICFDSSAARLATPAQLLALAGGGGLRGAQVWPHAQAADSFAAGRISPCSRRKS